jgi:3-hydroxyisobutyrate dehydrogenase
VVNKSKLRIEQMELGFCGLGNMGTAMVTRFLTQGHRVTVWNRTDGKATLLLDRGAVWAATPAQVAAQNSIVFTCLRDDEAIKEVYTGSDGLLAGECAGRLFVDTSTVSAEIIQTVAETAQAKGSSFLECPVAGPPIRALEGRLMGFAGGSEGDFARAKPLLTDICEKVDLFGPLGSGNALKLAVNLPLLVYFAALGEALSLLHDVPADPQKIMGILAQSPGAANAMALVGPWIAEALAGREAGAAIMGLSVVRKDLHLMLDAAKRTHAELPVTAAALQTYDEAVEKGWGDRPFWNLAFHKTKS